MKEEMIEEFITKFIGTTFHSDYLPEAWMRERLPLLLDSYAQAKFEACLPEKVELGTKHGDLNCDQCDACGSGWNSCREEIINNWKQ